MAAISTNCARGLAHRRVADRARVVLRALARDDIARAVDWYRDHAGPDVALSLVDDVEEAVSYLAHYPASGSPRYARELDIPGLRSWPLNRFPYVIFYVVGSDLVDGWRVLHAHRDIPTSFAEHGSD